MQVDQAKKKDNTVNYGDEVNTYVEARHAPQRTKAVETRESAY